MGFLGWVRKSPVKDGVRQATGPLSEQLESRWLLSLNSGPVHGVLVLPGTPQGDSYVFSVDNVTNDVSVQFDGDSNLFAIASVKLVVINAGNGADSVQVLDPNGLLKFRMIILGGAGNDTLGGANGPNIIVGGAGDDSIDGGAAADTIVDANGDNILNGNGGNDRIVAGAGNDNISGGDGNDIIVTGNGANTVNGGAGNDTVVCGVGKDSVDGGAGNDVVAGSFGDDTLNGDAGDDRLLGGPGNNVLSGGDDNDILVGGNNSDTIDGGNGNDILLGAGGSDDLIGGPGTDKINGGLGSDHFSPDDLDSEIVDKEGKNGGSRDGGSDLGQGIIPADVTNLFATDIDDQSIHLSWEYAGPAIDGFTLEESTTDDFSNAQPLVGEDPMQRSFDDTGLVSGTTYFFRIYAYHDQATSEFYSNSASAST